MNSGPTNNIPKVVAIVPPMTRSGFGRSEVGCANARQPNPTASRTTPAPANRCAGLGGAGRPDSAATIDDRAARARRPPRRDHGGHDREDHRRHDRPPLQVESVDAVIDEALEAGRERDPRREAQRPRRRRRRRRRRPLRWRPSRGEPGGRSRRARPSMPSARSRRCAMTAKPAAATRPTNSRPMVSSARTTIAVAVLFDGRAGSDADRVARRAERVDLPAGRVEQDRHLRGRVGLARRDERELVVEVQRVLDQSDDVAGHAVRDEADRRRAR